MPIKSKAEWKWLAVNKPELLHKFQQEAPVDYAHLHERVPLAKPPKKLRKK